MVPVEAGEELTSAPREYPIGEPAPVFDDGAADRVAGTTSGRNGCGEKLFCWLDMAPAFLGDGTLVGSEEDGVLGTALC
ncbi:MAG: hypothetical protein WC076_04940 [Terrimicrobiaceae bacterium]|nr:hypothetical protein [Terrimicrobiaceae bacterium]